VKKNLSNLKILITDTGNHVTTDLGSSLRDNPIEPIQIIVYTHSQAMKCIVPLSGTVRMCYFRCHFSPKVTTNSDYIITGSHCGSCYIYSINEPSKPPINLDNHTETVKGFPMLDESDIEDKDEDYEPASMSDDEEDDRRSRTIIRDCVWNDSCIITGDWAERLKAYYPV
jgi:hypothetical protein